MAPGRGLRLMGIAVNPPAPRCATLNEAFVPFASRLVPGLFPSHSFWSQDQTAASAKPARIEPGRSLPMLL